MYMCVWLKLLFHCREKKLCADCNISWNHSMQSHGNMMRLCSWSFASTSIDTRRVILDLWFQKKIANRSRDRNFNRTSEIWSVHSGIHCKIDAMRFRIFNTKKRGIHLAQGGGIVNRWWHDLQKNDLDKFKLKWVSANGKSKSFPLARSRDHWSRHTYTGTRQAKRKERKKMSNICGGLVHERKLFFSFVKIKN